MAQWRYSPFLVTQIPTLETYGFPPPVQLLAFSFARNPDVHHLEFGIVDDTNTDENWEFIALFTNITFLDLKVSPSFERWGGWE